MKPVVVVPETFLEERKYIISVLLLDFLGLEYDLISSPLATDYVIELPGGRKLEFRDHFFSKIEGDGYLDSCHLPTSCEFFEVGLNGRSHDLVAFYGDPKVTIDEKSIVCGTDVFASAFFMLSRWEEFVADERDLDGRFPENCAAAYMFGFLERPIVNEYVEFLWDALLHLGIHQERKARSFKFHNTHDIDKLYLFESSQDYLTKPIKSFLRDRRPSSFTRVAGLGVQSLLGNDPYDNFRMLMDVSESAGVESHFFFMAANRTSKDNGYDPGCAHLHGILDEIRMRGHVIGFHPSYHAYRNQELFSEEKARLERAVGDEVKVGRQHYLRFEVPDTWIMWNNSNMKWDSSMCYPRALGFRCGTCYSYHPFDILGRKKLSVLELPLTLMDRTILLEGSKNPQDAYEKVLHFVDVVREYRGDFVFLWHNSSFEYLAYHDYGWIYRATLESLI